MCVTNVSFQISNVCQLFPRKISNLVKFGHLLVFGEYVGRCEGSLAEQARQLAPIGQLLFDGLFDVVVDRILLLVVRVAVAVRRHESRL